MNTLDPRLQRDCLMLGRYGLSHLLLMNESRYPWFILVPDRPNVTEIFQLSDADQVQLMRESSALARLLAETFRADKMNIAALGNVVAQLHIHHIVRHRDDPAWPEPVWGKFPPQAYDQAALDTLLQRLRAAGDPRIEFAL
jgi:diadenosine tetraphosphate (Ap4A) HIT family hydrolase